MTRPAKLIATVQGAATPEIQALFRAFVEGLDPALRVRGLIEEEPQGGRARLRSLGDGATYPIFRPLGSPSAACACGLDVDSVVTACEAVRGDIAQGCDLVVLSKFAKLEAERSGLADAFAAAVAAQTPILTSVVPKWQAAWSDFAAPLFVLLPPDLAAIQAWWRELARSTGEAHAAIGA